MNHLGNDNKMVGEDVSNEQMTAHATPNEELRRQILSHVVPKNEREWWAARAIERLEFELNAANQIIRQQQLLEEENLRLTDKIKQLYEGAEEQKLRIKRLEGAGDFLSRYLREMPYASDYLAQVDERILRISNWRRAKEDNL